MAVTPKQLEVAIKDWGVEFRPYPYSDGPWHGATTAGGWAPIGITHHHTAGSGALLEPGWNPSKTAMLRLLRIGHSALDGPLCHFAPMFVGKGKRVAYGIGWANCNHAGEGRAEVARRVRNGTFTGGVTGPDTVDGNPLFWGLEYVHPGTSAPWPDELLDSGHRVACAIAEASGWSRKAWPGSNLEHKEWSGRKIDRSWSGAGDGMRKAIATLAADSKTPELDGWVRSAQIRTAIDALQGAADLKEGAGRKHQAEALREHARELRKQFPDNPNKDGERG
jgi:hypothetical protein